MSAGGDSSRRSSSKSSEESTKSTPNIIEFVDSQDPNVKSAIQRHTAYHSAAQRRDARLQSLRRGNQSRYLEWGRRSSAEGQSTTSRSSSTASVPTPSPAQVRGRPSSTSRSASDTSEQGALGPSLTKRASNGEEGQGSVVLSQVDEEMLQYYVSTICLHTRSLEFPDMILSYMRTDDACSYLLVAYAFATKHRLETGQSADTNLQQAQYNFGKGTNILWNRLRNPVYAVSDANVQAVLLLIAYTADYGQVEELQIHQEALRTMIEERGGIEQFQSNSVLYHQLYSLNDSRRFHLTLGCESGCLEPVRALRPL